MTMGTKIEMLRKIKGLTQDQLAVVFGVSRQTIYKWEHDQVVPSLSKLEQIIEFFQISYDELLKEDKTIKVTIK